jgi:transcriptional regulator with XRE-family HTH domain
MSVHEKIKLARIAKGWTQEDLAERLQMSINGYGDLERGNRDIKLSKLEQISDLLDIDLSSLFSSEKGIFNLSTGHSYQHNNNSCTITSAKVETLELKHALETQQLLNTEKDGSPCKPVQVIKSIRYKNQNGADFF